MPCKKERAVIVTTSHRGTFYGMTYDSIENADMFRLRNARCVIRWGTTGGFNELAATGPTGSTKASPMADMEINAVTCVLDVSEIAKAKWDALVE